MKSIFYPENERGKSDNIGWLKANFLIQFCIILSIQTK
jgi:hypothetical protein